MSPRLRVISLGAGVQSTTMALMAAHGEITPMPDCAIFADTGDEPAAVYAHLRWLISALPFPVHTTEKSKLSDATLAGDKEARPPLFVETIGGVGMLGRQCTRNFKLKPIRRKTRELLGVGPRGYVAPGLVEAWIGISLDEIIRCRPSGLRYIVNRHPLIERAINRRGCKAWLVEHGYQVPPKSACWHCHHEKWFGDKQDARHSRGTAGTAYDEPIGTRTTGWEPGCKCDAAIVPCTVLDPFGGAGTTGLVADRLQRNAILIELNESYALMARRRIDGDAPLFSQAAEGATDVDRQANPGERQPAPT